MRVIETYANFLSINGRDYVVYQHGDDVIDMIVAPWAEDMWVRFSCLNKAIYDNTHLRGVVEEIILYDFNITDMDELYDGIFNYMSNIRIKNALAETVAVLDKPKRRM